MVRRQFEITKKRQFINSVESFYLKRILTKIYLFLQTPGPGIYIVQ